jgi:hypothetical protein
VLEFHLASFHIEYINCYIYGNMTES